MSFWDKLFSWQMLVFFICFFVIMVIFVRYLLRKQQQEFEQLIDIKTKDKTNKSVDILIDSFPQPILLLSKSGKLLKYNKEFEVLTKSLSPQEYINQNSFIQNFIKSKLNHQLLEREIDNRTFYVDLVRISDQRFNRFLVVYSEITQIKDVYLRQETFINDLKHEIKTPLTALIGLSNILVEQGLDDEKSYKIVKTINNEANRISELFTSLTKSLKDGVKYQTFSLEDLFDDLTLIYSKKSKENLDIIFCNYVEGDIVSDPALLKQILINLIDNSLKFTNNGYIKTSAYLSNNHLKIVVVDTGNGISQDDIDYIYDRFYRGDKSRISENGGYGLGLSIVSQLINCLGGDIKVESDIGKGTTFTIRLEK